MNTRTKIVGIAAALIALIALLWAATSVTAQPPPQGPGGDEPGSTVPTWTHVQGRLYAGGNPAPDGTYSVRFRLYTASDAAEGDYVWQQTKDVDTSRNGLFSTYLSVDQGDFNGQALWLGIKVEADAEMSPRRPILPVPYALGLRPGALVSDTANLSPVLRTFNAGSAAAFSGRSIGGNGVYGQSDVQDATKAAVYGYASEHASGVYGESVHGHGVYGKATDTGTAAVYAEGAIQSTGKSYLWISGNDMVMGTYTTGTGTPTLAPEPGAANLSTLGYDITTDLYLPVTIPGVLYGQNVKVKSIRVYHQWTGSGATNYIGRTQLTRLSAAGAWEVLVDDTTHRDSSATPTYYELAIPIAQQTLSSEEGPLGLFIQVYFGSGPITAWINGVRLELEHY